MTDLAAAVLERHHPRMFNALRLACDACDQSWGTEGCDAYRAALALDATERVARLAERLEAEWYNGNIPEDAYRRIVKGTGLAYPSAAAREALAGDVT